jgi:calmodulin
MSSAVRVRRASTERTSRRSSYEKNSSGSASARGPTKQRTSRRSKESNYVVNNFWAPPRKPSTAELGQARRVFFQLDKDGTGAIDLDELRTMLRSMGQDPTDAELKELIASVDQDRDGQIQMREFLQLYTRGIDAKPSVGALDVNDAFASFGGNPKDKESKVGADAMHDQMLDMYGLDIDCSELFSETSSGGDLTKKDFEMLLQTPKATSRQHARRGGVTLPPINQPRI